MNLETLLPLYADWFIFELLEFLIEDGGCCCFMLVGLVAVSYTHLTLPTKA